MYKSPIRNTKLFEHGIPSMGKEYQRHKRHLHETFYEQGLPSLDAVVNEWAPPRADPWGLDNQLPVDGGGDQSSEGGGDDGEVIHKYTMTTTYSFQDNDGNEIVNDPDCGEEVRNTSGSWYVPNPCNHDGNLIRTFWILVDGKWVEDGIEIYVPCTTEGCTGGGWQVVKPSKDSPK